MKRPILLLGSSNKVFQFDLDTQSMLQFGDMASEIKNIVVSQSFVIVSAAKKSLLYIYDHGDLKSPVRTIVIPGIADMIALSQDEQVLSIVTNRRTLFVYTVSDGSLRGQMTLGTNIIGKISNLKWSLGDNILVVTAGSTVMVIPSVEVMSIPCDTSRPYSSISSDHKSILSLSMTSTITTVAHYTDDSILVGLAEGRIVCLKVPSLNLLGTIAVADSVRMITTLNQFDMSIYFISGDESSSSVYGIQHMPAPGEHIIPERLACFSKVLTSPLIACFPYINSLVVVATNMVWVVCGLTKQIIKTLNVNQIGSDIITANLLVSRFSCADLICGMTPRIVPKSLAFPVALSEFFSKNLRQGSSTIAQIDRYSDLSMLSINESKYMTISDDAMKFEKLCSMEKYLLSTQNSVESKLTELNEKERSIISVIETLVTEIHSKLN